MRAGVKLALVSALLAATVILLFAGTARAQDIDCLECHEGFDFESPAHPDIVCQDCHTNVTEEHDGTDLEPLTDADSCLNCHSRIDRTIGRSVHDGQAGCIDC